MHQLSPGKNNRRAAQNRWAPQLQGRHLDSNVGNIGRIGCEAAADRVEIGQSVAIEFGVDGGELGLAGSVMGERQQPDHCAARLLLAGNASKAR